MITRLARHGALLALVLSGLMVGPAVAVGTAKPVVKSWFGQVQRHNGHFDYVGRPCAESENVCADYVAHYRISPTTRQAERGLRRSAGGWARLWGEFFPARDAGHQGMLKVSRVEPKKAPKPWPAPARSGVEGTVTAGPTCPVERPDQPCPPRPVGTALHLTDRSGSEVAAGRSGSDGRFSIDAPSGRYALTADYGSGRVGGCPPVAVNVSAARYTHVDLECDTGIR
jgi:hypothetical protein